MFKTFLFIFFPIFLTAIDYSVSFIGLDDAKALKTVKTASSLTRLQKQPPSSINALRFRSESAIPDIIKALHAHGYYEAKATIQLKEAESKVEVLVFLFPGPCYTINTFTVSVWENKKILDFPYLNAENLKIQLGEPVNAKEILHAEETVFSYLSENGYPLAFIEKKEMVADYATKNFLVNLQINSGLISKFGQIYVTGAPHIEKKFFNKKVQIIPGDLYDSRIIEKTQKELLNTGLFSSVIISHKSKQNKRGELPIHINLAETKHKNINAGISYQTSSGFGLSFGWENKNISRLGRKVSLQGDIAKEMITGTGTFIVPDAGKINLDYILQLQALQKSMPCYDKNSYSMSNTITKKNNTNYTSSLGVTIEQLIVAPHAIIPPNTKDKPYEGPKQTFSLIECPFHYTWSSVFDFLNPTNGYMVKYTITPTNALPNSYYIHHSINFMYYYPFTKTNSFILAQHLMIKSIITKDLHKVPLPKRIFGGSNQDLRGYRDQTVSNLDIHGVPQGGRFGIFYTVEPRFRLTKSIGIVPFLDIGYIEDSITPKFDQKWYASIGIGLTYFTFLGPIRLDYAYPLNGRKDIDFGYRILLNIGQTF